MKFMTSANRLKHLICKFQEGINVYEGSIPFARSKLLKTNHLHLSKQA
jgi:hypothetical protein